MGFPLAADCSLKADYTDGAA